MTAIVSSFQPNVIADKKSVRRLNCATDEQSSLYKLYIRFLFPRWTQFKKMSKSGSTP